MDQFGIGIKILALFGEYPGKANEEVHQANVQKSNRYKIEFDPPKPPPLSPHILNLDLNDSIESRFKNRKLHLDRYCQAWTRAGRAAHQFKTIKTGIAYPDANLLLCAPWKCGSSYWRQLVVKLHLKNDPGWSDARVRGVDPVYSAPTIMEKRRLLHSQETVSVIVARHPFISNEMKILPHSLRNVGDNLRILLTDTLSVAIVSVQEGYHD